MLAGKTIVLGVTGSVAVHYIPELIGQLRWRYLATVRAVMTPAAARFITPLLLESATEMPVDVDMWAAAARTPVSHIQLAHLADIVLVAPATADSLGRIAHGLADDLVSLTVLATQAPVVFAPAMHDTMWANPVVQDNVARLKGRGYHFVGPERGMMTLGQVGEGRMASIGAIIARLMEVVANVSTSSPPGEEVEIERG